MKNRAAFMFVWGTLFAFQAACVIAVMDRSESGDFLPGKSLRKTLPFDPGGTIFLENQSGDIEITGWDKEEAEITATGGGLSSKRRGIRMVSLRDSAPDVDIEKDGNSLRIRPAAPRRKGSEIPEAVDFLLRVPHSVNLKDIILRRGGVQIADLYGEAAVDIKEGDCTVENFSGSLFASVGIGDVEAEVLDLRGGDTIKITVEEGDIVLYLQPEVGAKIEAGAPRGKVSSDFDLEEAQAAGKIRVELGDSGAAVSLLALDGDIRILKTR